MKKIVLCVAMLSSMAFAVKPFELPWMNAGESNKTFKSSDYNDGIFVVEAYFLGCYYCNQNAPQVDDLASKFSGNNRVHVLDVGIDRQDSDYATWINRHHPNHPVLKDASRSLIKQLGTTGYPSTYVLDCKGNVTYSTVGTWDSEAREGLENAVQTLASQDCSNSN